MSGAKLWQIFLREYVFKHTPSGVVRLAYLWPWLPKAWVWHRRLWWANTRSRPRLIFLSIELSAWVRWMMYGAVLSVLRLMGRIKLETLVRLEMSSLGLGWRLLLGCWRFAVRPTEALAFNVHRKSHFDPFVVLESETGGYHRCCNRHRRRYREVEALLKDKDRLAETLRQAGIPIVEILARRRKGVDCSLNELAAWARPVFVKGCHLSAGTGSFAYLPAEGAGALYTHAGVQYEVVEEQQRVLDRLSQMDDTLVQPLLQVHPLFLDMCPHPYVASLRVCTRWVGGEVRVLALTLEIPVVEDQVKQYRMFAIDPVSLKIQQPVSPENPSTKAPQVDGEFEKIKGIFSTNVSDGAGVPFLDEIKRFSQRAHQVCGDIEIVAWDWVPTSTGPVCLEGNSGWGVRFLQTTHGAFLRPESMFYPGASGEG